MTERHKEHLSEAMKLAWKRRKAAYKRRSLVSPRHTLDKTEIALLRVLLGRLLEQLS